MTCQQANAWLVYNNSTNYINGDVYKFSPTWGSSPRVNHQVGDQIFIASYPTNEWYGISRMTNFDFEYFGSGASGDERLQVRFYLNDGDEGAPGTLFFDSGSIDISTPEWQTTKGTVEFTESDLIYMGQAVQLPSVFTWTVEFSGTTGAGEDWGLYLYSPPTLGNSYTSYWNFDPDTSTWLLSMGPIGVNMDFGARVWGVPEPSTASLAVAGGLLILLLGSRVRRK